MTKDPQPEARLHWLEIAIGMQQKPYGPKTGNPMMAVTLGRRGGVTHLPSPIGVVRTPWVDRKLKADHMRVPRVREALGL